MELYRKEKVLLYRLSVKEGLGEGKQRKHVKVGGEKIVKM
jgi:hypothetical protein